ncbi:hypothetical protein [Pseudoclavibacter sp. 13-3]|uniref:hypothetical protein n=1 Tax=Pseudoclavibacter sp. 13-3 TaxID=2901228 RepID=UPI001E3A64CB|nr:hypothetical protein [Pseudoclavibacter sp. 13-3]MCD7101735.1 hypothetical protein [Pseudoclavibacter sp. 13-3]
MITSYFLGSVIWIVTALFEDGVLPDFELPGDPGSAVSQMGGFVSQASGLGAWVPWTVAWSALAIGLAVYGATLLFKLVRVILGHVPQVGGNG